MAESRQKLFNLVLIAGFSRCGTTWLHNSLCAHDKINTAIGRIKEVGYFDYIHRDQIQDLYANSDLSNRNARANAARFDALRRAQGNLAEKAVRLKSPDSRRLALGAERIQDFVENFAEDDDWYIRQFENHEDAWCLDSTPSYSRLPVAGWRHIRTLAKNLKVVVTVREPSSRLRSALQHQMAKTGRDWTSLKQSRRLGIIRSASNPYVTTLKRMNHALDPSQIDVLIFERVMANKVSGLAGLFDQLGLQPVGALSESGSNPPNPSRPIEFNSLELREIAIHSRDVLNRLVGILPEIPSEWLEAQDRLAAELT